MSSHARSPPTQRARSSSSLLQGKHLADSDATTLREVFRSNRTALALLTAWALALQFGWFALGVPLDRSQAMFGDELDYWTLSETGLQSVLRPPGYPALVAVSRAIAGDSTSVLFILQSVLAAFVAPLLFALSRLLPIRVSGVGILVLSMSATSLTAAFISKRVLADGPLAFSLTLALVLLAAASRGAKTALAAGLALAASLLLKPLAVVAIAFSPAALFLLGLRGRNLFRRSATVLAPCALAYVAVVGVNWRQEGVPTYSLISDLTIQRYWVPLTLTLGETKGKVDAERVAQLRRDWSPRGISADYALSEAVAARKPEAWGVLLDSPMWASAALGASAWVNLWRPFAPQEMNHSVLPWRGLASIGRVACWALWLLAFVGFARLGLRPVSTGVALTLGSIVALWVGASSISHLEGARLVYPIEGLLFLFAAAAVPGSTRRAEIQSGPEIGSVPDGARRER